jgi:hypothetical protein
MFNFIASLFQGGRTIKDLASQMGCSKEELLFLPISYSRFTIPKRSGGLRVIHAPAPELKRIQRLIARRVLNRYSCHRAAMAYERGRSILDNALPHAQQELVLKMDLTSPRLSNLVNGGLDKMLAGMAKAYGFNYTRYADDLTFCPSFYPDSS